MVADDHYYLAIDVGTSRIAAAIARVAPDGSLVTTPFALGRRGDSASTVVYVTEEGGLLFGDAAERRGIVHPERLVREFKRRIGDDVPILVADTPVAAEQLYAQTVVSVVDAVTERERSRPASVMITHPTAWGSHRLGLIQAALADLGIDDVELMTEPEAAARHYEATRPLAAGAVLAVYDFGGGTFDTAILRKEPDGTFALVSDPAGIDNLGGADFDDAVLRHVIRASGLPAAELGSDDTETRMALAQLYRECVEAKEALSFDSDATVPVLIPPSRATVRITRSEFEDMIDPALGRTIDALEGALETAEVEVDDVEAILLVGGTSRIPRVAQRLSEQFGLPIAIDADPKSSIALGAARTALVRQHDEFLGVTSTDLARIDDDDISRELGLIGAGATAGALVPVAPAGAVVLAAARPAPRSTSKWYAAALTLGTVVVAGAIVVGGSLAAGSRGASDEPVAKAATSSSASPSPTAAAVAPIAAAPPAATDTSSRESQREENRAQRRNGNSSPAPYSTPTKPPTPSPKPSSPSPTNPSSPSPSNTPSPDPTTPSPTPTPDPTTPSPTPTPTPDPTTPTPEPTTPSPEPTTPSPEPTTPEPEPTTPAPEPEPTQSEPPAPDPEPEPTQSEPPAPDPTPSESEAAV